jgi:hypothetical protein
MSGRLVTWVMGWMRRDDGDGVAAALRVRLRQVYWIAGGCGAGKSTVARCIAIRWGMSVYSADEVMSNHAGCSTREDAPCLGRFVGMSMDERWVDRSPETMLETFHWFRGEGFGLTIDDLLRLEDGTGVIAECFPAVAVPRQAAARRAWPRGMALLTPEFRRAAFDRRGWAIPRRTSKPELAQRNLIECDRMFTDHLVEDTERFELLVIEVDCAMNEDELTGT